MTYQPPAADTLPSRPSTQLGIRFSHTMYRIADPRASLEFYVNGLGMTLVHRMESEGGRFTNYFLCYPRDPVVPQGEAERKKWLWDQEGMLELCHNWGDEIEPKKKYYHGNEDEHKGYGHICLTVPDLQEACARFDRLSMRFVKRPEEGAMKHIAFLSDPDGYRIEILARQP